MNHVVIAGYGTKISRRFGDTLEAAIHSSVTAALQSAGLSSINDIALVVTVASDLLDGIMVPLRSEIAGSCGRAYFNVPSSAGHALAAAATMIESGQASNALLVGWGEGSKYAREDSRAAQADPFYARPVGGEPAAMSLLQAQRLLSTRRHTLADLEQYNSCMRARVPKGAEPDSSGIAISSFMPAWCDGAAALVLATSSPGDGRVRIGDFASTSRPYWPEVDDLDPARWVVEAMALMREPAAGALDRLAVVEAGALPPLCEIHALGPLLDARHWALSDSRVNPSGGGANACFGPASGLARVIGAAEALRRNNVNEEASHGLVLDLAGPLGQMVTVMRLQHGGIAA